MQEPKPAVYTQRHPSDSEEISGIGLVLDEAITFKKVQNDLVKLISSGCDDPNVCALLDITPELLDKFKTKLKRKIKKVHVDLGLSSEGTVTKERSFWEFVKETNGDLDLLAWASYYSCLDQVRQETNNIIHSVDKSVGRTRTNHAGGRGIFFQRSDLIGLLRLNFKRKYDKDIVKYVQDHKLNIFKISCKEVDRTTLLPPNREKGQHVQVRVIRFISVKILDESFVEVIEARQRSMMEEKEKMEKLLEIREDNVLLPPYDEV